MFTRLAGVKALKAAAHFRENNTAEPALATLRYK